MRSRDVICRSVLAVLLGLVVVCAAGPVLAQESTPGQEQERQQEQEQKKKAGDERPEKFIKVYVENWKWTPDVIRVEQGTLLKIEFLSYEASRRFDLPAYKIKLPLPQDKPVSFEFVADKKGEFKFRCGRPCGDGCAKLKGKLIVE